MSRMLFIYYSYPLIGKLFSYHAYFFPKIPQRLQPRIEDLAVKVFKQLNINDILEYIALRHFDF